MFNPSAFAVPAAYTYGNEKMNPYTSDEVSTNLDMSLFRNFHVGLGESRFFEFRAEAFNLFNNVHIRRSEHQPQRTARQRGNPTFGTVNSQQNAPRSFAVGPEVQLLAASAVETPDGVTVAEIAAVVPFEFDPSSFAFCMIAGVKEKAFSVDPGAMRRRTFLGALAALVTSKLGWATPCSVQQPPLPRAPKRTGARRRTSRFEDIAAKAGVHFVTENCPTPEKHQPETMPAGVALFDYDGDGLLDIYLVNGAEMPSLVKAGPKYYNRLFHNNGDGTFTDVTERAGVAGAGYGMGVAVGDYDNDGWPDLFVANVNGNQLFHNNGDGTFTDVTAKAGLSGALHNGRKMWSIAAGWFDYNHDGLLDLFVVNYVEWDPRYEPACMGLNGRGYCHPGSFAPLPNTLYRNNGDGTFTDVSAETGISAVLGKGMGVVFADYDGDGLPRCLCGQRQQPESPLS